MILSSKWLCFIPIALVVFLVVSAMDGSRAVALSIKSDLTRAVFQRNSQNQASVPFSGSVLLGITSVEAKAIPRSGSVGTDTGWQVIDANPSSGSFAGALKLDGGWYDIGIRSLSGSTVIESRLIERVGAGEVFVTAGQSNASNAGTPALSATDDRVSSFNLFQWGHAEDPQPIATDLGGSPWTPLGDALAAELNVPIGFVSVAWGATTVENWLPGAPGPNSQPLYNRIRDSLIVLGPNGVRAVLWHQGESDSFFNTSTADYQQRLETIIAQSRIDSGYEIPWGVAQASYISMADPSDANIVNAQKQVAANDPLTFEGAVTDNMFSGWRAPDGIHFNELGLREHARRWFDQLMSTFDFVQFSADFDSDDDVDAADLAAWSTGFGMASGANLASGDADSDQDVDGNDFLTWQRNFGRSVNGVSAGTVSEKSASDTIPEPSTILLAAIAAIFVASLDWARRENTACKRNLSRRSHQLGSHN